MAHQPHTSIATRTDPTAPSPQSNAADEAQARIDDDITALHLSICALRTKRNTLSPISRLPPETLAIIFVHCARHYYYCEDLGAWKAPPWLNVSYICRHWRDVALNCASLWTFLFVSSQRWTEELLYRSKMAPLKIRIDVRYSKHKELMFLEKAAAYAGRVQHLSLKLTRHTVEGVLPKLSSRAPLLKTLRIAVERSGHFGERQVVLDTLFNGDTPALRTLELSNCYISWSSSVLCGLTNLRLRDLTSSSQPTITELIAMLRRMPNLVYLYLENALTSASQFILNSEGLDLPRLSRLALIAPFSAIVAFLTHVRIPLKTEARIKCRYENSNNDYTPLYPLLAKRFNNTSETQTPVILSLVIESSPCGLQFVLSTFERDFDRRPYSSTRSSYDAGHLCEDWDCGIPLKLDIDFWSTTGMDREGLIGGVCRSVSLTHLRGARLTIDITTSLSPAFWKGTFGHLQELRFIRMTDTTRQGLAAMLSLGPHHRSENQDGATVEGSLQVFAPSLAELELESVDFSEDCLGRTQGNSDQCTTSALCLYDALSRRKAGGYALRQLVISDCMYVYGHHVAKWEKVVDKVDWDMVTRTEDDYEDEDDEDDDEDEYYDDEYDPYGVGYFDDFY
ncbi:hypothetical protein BU15DRAFT_71678 [Melanogaster broomeanus]|nr:hypothetical protein BU15DRAFT_71678 [Melanogaster broomeanus]